MNLEKLVIRSIRTKYEDSISTYLDLASECFFVICFLLSLYFIFAEIRLILIEGRFYFKQFWKYFDLISYLLTGFVSLIEIVAVINRIP